MKQEECRVSLVVVNWNTRDLLADCLRSLREAAAGIPAETWVVDNGSTDGSPDMVEKKFPDVRLIRNAANRGFAAAVNQGLEKGGGESFLLVNSDAQLTGEALQGLLGYLDDHPDTGVVGPQLLHADGSLQNSIDNLPTLATELLNKSVLKRLFPKRYPGKRSGFTEPVEVESVIGACMGIRGKCLEETGLFDDRFFFFLEETDFCARARQAGWKVVHLPDVRVRHLQGATAGKNRTSARIEYYRSRYRFFEKHRGKLRTVLLRGGLMIRLAVNLLSGSVRTLLTGFSRRSRERLKTDWALWAWHWRGCPNEEGLRQPGAPVESV